MTMVMFTWIFIVPMLLVGSFCIGVKLFEIMCDIYEDITGKNIDQILRSWEEDS